MQSIHFRSIMMERLRAFDNWAWMDAREHPEDWLEDKTPQEWMEMFKDFIGGTFD